ncbi:hypothetical protein Vadar_022228 [Vaccinium darrowii]|uniref:Uncharacterized protein n=1 Tax=Vaccinium darrowii TaxID=229202 RepID=A0ACB7YNI9_9ERIC|nr:hypothetical protein Vadar_022228 [Vaccinium darrowii]
MLLDQISAKSIFSGCLNLEWLRLKIILPETFCIDAPSLHLETLILHDCYGVKKIDVASVGLTTFEYIGKVKSFTFLNVPRLEKVHIRFVFANLDSTRYMFHGLANDLPWLQILSLVLTTVELLSVPTTISRFNHLKQLELFVMKSSDFNLLSLTSLLNAAPLLQKFHLSVSHQNLSYEAMRLDCVFVAEDSVYMAFGVPPDGLECSFGMAFCTLGYRALEVLMGFSQYSSSIDMRSVGSAYLLRC